MSRGFVSIWEEGCRCGAYTEQWGDARSSISLQAQFRGLSNSKAREIR